MSSTSDNSREREVICLLYDLLVRWDQVLDFTDQTIKSIEERRLFPIGSLGPCLRNQNHVKENEQTINQQILDDDYNDDWDQDSIREATKNNSPSHSNKKVGTKDKTKKITKHKKRKTYSNELEENLMKLDDIIDFYTILKRRAQRTVLSHGNKSKAAKDVNQEIKEEIQRFQTLSLND